MSLGTDMGGATGLKGLLAQARRAAMRRGQPVSTAHALLVMVQGDPDAARLMAARGVREIDVIRALKSAHEEPASALEVAVERAHKIAREVGESTTRPLHLLLAIAREARSLGHDCLAKTEGGVAQLREDLVVALGGQSTRAATTRATSEKPISQNARRGSWTKTTPPPGAALPQGIRTATGKAGPLADMSVRPPARSRGDVRPKQNVRTNVASLREALTPEPETSGGIAPADEPKQGTSASSDSGGEAAARFELTRERFPMLFNFGRNLTTAAAEGRIDPVIGRDREIEKLLDVLARRRANNPILVGPPGVGKTAVVEALAVKLADDGLRSTRFEGVTIVELSSGALVSGTGVRGALGDRIRRLCAEVVRSNGKVILFLDEIHTLVGGPEGPDDLANELKAALSRGDLRCIGATTEVEYRRRFERDPALARRFTRIDVDEPTAEVALDILRGLAPRYEAHHEVRYDDDALHSAVQLSARFLSERHLPDKAIGTIDLAGARASRLGRSSVAIEDVAGVIAHQAGVPVERLLMQDAERLLALEEHLGDRVVGQDAAVIRISMALRKAAAGFRGGRPLGTFLLLGPTGVGKTETAKAVSELLFPGSPLGRFDMSEYSEAHAVARLLGAPPGYVGHEDGGQLTEAVRRRPYQLILLDEIEKAHPDVWLSLLPMLDEGRLTDSRGRTVDFTNVVVFMTSNLGSAAASPGAKIGFGQESEIDDAEVERAVLDKARGHLPPELWNRIDEPLYFRALRSSDIATIARRMLGEVQLHMERERSVKLEFDDATVDTLGALGGFDAAFGARPMRRTIARHVEAQLAAAVLEGKLPKGSAAKLRGTDTSIELDIL